MVNRAHVTRSVLALGILLLAVACGGTKKETALPAGSRVLALGDSLTAPHGVKPGEDWPTLLAQKTGWVVINAGVSGNTSAQALDRLPALLDEHNPQLVLVTLGGNDMLRKLPQTQTVANLGQHARPGQGARRQGGFAGDAETQPRRRRFQ